MTQYWREASSLLLVARVDGDSARPTSPDYRVLTQRRSGSSPFMPSVISFPGGTLSPVDWTAEWLPLFRRLTDRHEGEEDPFNGLRRRLGGGARRPAMLTTPRDWPLPADVVFRICAVRETFEECGILVVADRQQATAASASDAAAAIARPATPQLDSVTLRDWQRRVCANPDAFLTLCHRLDVVPHIWALAEWSNWLTPPLAEFSAPSPSKKPRRYDTMFYACCIDGGGRLLEVAVDNHETSEAQWSFPSELLALPKGLIVVQKFELRRLVRFDRFAELATFARDRERVGTERIMTVTTRCRDGAITALPGDCLYDSDPDYTGTRGTDWKELPDSAVELCSSPSRPMNRFVFLQDEPQSRLWLVSNVSLHGHAIPLNDPPPLLKQKL